MVVTRDADAEATIHITGTGSRSVKRKSAKQRNKGKLLKKPRVAISSNNGSTKNANERAPEAASATDRIPDVSFRHLFSFASTSHADSQQQETSTLGTAQAFTFLPGANEGERTSKVTADANSQPAGPGVGSYHTETKEIHPITDHNAGMQTVQPVSGSLYAEELRDHNQTYRAARDGTGPSPFLYQTSNAQDSRQDKTKIILSCDALMIPDDIDSRPDQILRIATMFCRQKDVEQLEEDWCAPSGVRETMRRDFKQKRQNVARGRKLGSSGKR